MTTKAAVYRGNKTFPVEAVTTPPPGMGQVQIDVAYCGICGTDLHIYLGHMDKRVGFERTIGHEMSGVIAAVGERCIGASGWATHRCASAGSLRVMSCVQSGPRAYLSQADLYRHRQCWRLSAKMECAGPYNSRVAR